MEVKGMVGELKKNGLGQYLSLDGKHINIWGWNVAEYRRHTIHPMPDNTLQDYLTTGKAVLDAVPEGWERDKHAHIFVVSQGVRPRLEISIRAIPTPELDIVEVLERLNNIISRGCSHVGAKEMINAAIAQEKARRESESDGIS